MRIHYFQHASFENVSNIGKIARKRGHSIYGWRLYEKNVFPSVELLDCLVVMGGPMNIYEEKKYSWLKHEKKFIEETIREGKVVVGVCLGAQLIADVLGAVVKRNEYREIGWFPVRLSDLSKKSYFFKGFNKKFFALHWHGDTFAIPRGALRLAESSACRNQAFEYGKNVLAMQFHIECSSRQVKSFVKNCDNDLIDGRFVQTKEEIVSGAKYMSSNEILLNTLFDNIETLVL